MTKEKQNHFNIPVVSLFHFLKFLSHGYHSHRALGKTVDQAKFTLSGFHLFFFPHSYPPRYLKQANCTSLTLPSKKNLPLRKKKFEIKKDLRLLREKLVLNRIIQCPNKNTECHQTNSCYVTSKVTVPTKLNMTAPEASQRPHTRATRLRD